MSFKTKVVIEGKEHEVEIPGVIAEATVTETMMPKTAFEAELKRRVGSITEGSVKVEEIDKADDATKARIAEKLGLKPAGGPAADQATADIIAKAKETTAAEIRASEVKPREDRLKKAETRVQLLTRQSLRSQILSAAASMGVKKSLLAKLTADTPEPIVSMLEPAFAYDADHESWFVRDGDGFKLAPAPTATRLHMNIEEFVRGWVADKINGDFVDPTGQAGPGIGGAPSGGPGAVAGKDVILTADQAADHGTYELAQEQAKKQGGIVRVKRPEAAY